MQSAEKLCQLCANDLDESILLSTCENLKQFQKILSFQLSEATSVCSICFLFVGKVIKFADRCERAHHVLNLVADPDFDSTRKEFGLGEGKSDQATDTVDLQLGIKDEFIDTQNQDEPLDCNDSFNELEDLGEIATIELPDDSSFVISNDDIGKGDGKEEVKEELETNIEEEETKLEYSCHVCKETFKNFFSLHSHCRKDHEVNPEVICSCGSTLSSRAQIHLHKKLHKTDKTYACNQCDKMYSHQQSLHTHIRKVHPVKSKSVLGCAQCPKHFASEKKLRIHKQVHLPEDKKFTVNCPYCDKKFTKSVNVQAHIRAIHQMERPFLCSDCGKDFSTKGALKEHQIIHSDNYPFQCSFCPKKFKNLPRLKTHEDIHNETQYICNICGISLNTKRTLKMHMVVHSDQKKYKCQYCGSSFKRSKALKNHLILHSGLRPYACPWCDKTFANGSNCRSHKKKSHPHELSAFEASGKSSNAAPNIPRLEQLQPKSQQHPPQMITVDGTNMILHQMPSEIKSELPSLNVEAFQVQHLVQSRHLEPQSQ